MADLIETLRAKYPNKEFFIGKFATGGIDDVIYMVHNDMAIFNPFDSDCGRFVQEDLYGLDHDDAVALRDFNQSLVDAYFKD